MPTIKYKVTKEILQQAAQIRCSENYLASNSCPIALVTGGIAGSYEVQVLMDRQYKKAIYPPEVREYVVKFDNCSIEKITDLPELEFELTFD